MARSEHEDYDRQPRWNTAGYWTPGREGEDWPGDPSRSRDYNREDMRRYGQRVVERGEQLRRIRGQGGRREEWDRPPDRGPDFNQPRAGSQRGQDFDRGQDQRFGRDRSSENRRGQPSQRRQDAGRGQSGEGRDRWFDRERARREQDRGRFQGERDRRPGDNLVDNYWGRRETGRDYRVRDRGAWWNNEGGRGDVTSARGYDRRDLPTRPDFDWIEDRDYDMDPGFDYEFGTDFDLLDDFDREMFGRGGPAHSARNQEPLWDEEPNNRPDPRRIAGGYEYGWQGPPDRQRARYREVWNLPRSQRGSPRRR